MTLDLGTPPNLPPRLGGRTGLRLTRLEDLETDAPPAEVRAAQRIVTDEAARFRQWRRARAAAPDLARLLQLRACLARPSADEQRALHLEILRLKARAAA